MKKLLPLLLILFTLGPTAQATTTQIPTIVLLVNFSNDTTQPYTTTTAAGVMGQVAQFWSDSSYGQAVITTEVRGWLTIDDENTDCDYQTWQTKARALTDVTGFTHIVYGFSHAPNCPLGLGGGNLASGSADLFGGFLLERVNHEFGHSIGLDHPVTTDTPGGPRFGGDFYSLWFGAMWTATGAERLKLGWVTPTIVNASGTYTLAALSDGGVLRVPRPDGTNLDIDYRTDSEWADYPLNGVTIRHVTSSFPDIALIRSGPCGGYILGQGQSWYDAGARVLIHVDALSTAATVTVTLDADPPNATDTTPPSVPTGLQAKKGKSVNLWWTASTDDQDCSPSYRVYRNGVQIGTSSGTAFTDTSFPKRTTVAYRVSAVDDAGNESALSAAVTVRT